MKTFDSLLESVLVETIVQLIEDEEIAALLREWSSSGSDEEPFDDIKGWMSPSGKAHIITGQGEHFRNHHPEFLEKAKKNKRIVSSGPHSLGAAQRQGFVRFGKTHNSCHGHQAFVQYDARHPKGAETAMKALHYMKPHHTDEVSISGKSGLWDKGMSQNKAWNDLEVKKPASDAYRHLYKQSQKKKKAAAA